MSALSLKAVEAANPQALVAALTRRLNRLAEPPVSVTVIDDLVCFQADTWQPLLLARVEEALDEVIGSAWNCAFTWVRTSR